MLELVLEFFSYDLVRTILWFSSENPLLGNVTPIRLIQLGRHEFLHRFIEGSIRENYR